MGVDVKVISDISEVVRRLKYFLTLVLINNALDKKKKMIMKYLLERIVYRENLSLLCILGIAFNCI